jgi:hypothetical protein
MKVRGMRILRLPIKGYWRARIDAGIKGDEYRGIKPYYISRFFENLPKQSSRAWFDFVDDLELAPFDLNDIASVHGCKIREFDAVELIEGYGRTVPRSLYEWKGLTAGMGRMDWGAPRNKKVFIIHLGNKI